MIFVYSLGVYIYIYMCIAWIQYIGDSHLKQMIKDKQENCYQVQVGQREGKPPQMEHTQGNSGALTLYISFYAQAMV